MVDLHSERPLAPSHPARCSGGRPQGCEAGHHHIRRLHAYRRRSGCDRRRGPGTDRQVARICRTPTRRPPDPDRVHGLGRNRVDLGQLAAVTGEAAIRRATAREARDLTGFSIAGSRPSGTAHDVRIVMDPDLCPYPVVWASCRHRCRYLPGSARNAADPRQRAGRADRRRSLDPGRNWDGRAAALRGRRLDRLGPPESGRPNLAPTSKARADSHRFVPLRRQSRSPTAPNTVD